MAIKEINSQVNEQANAGLQCIRGQLAYMTPENFMFTLKLFLTIKNKDIQRKLDVITSCLRSFVSEMQLFSCILCIEYFSTVADIHLHIHEKHDCAQ